MMGMARGAWFRYSDRDEINPANGAIITTHQFTSVESGEFRGPVWESQEWQVQSYLVRLNDTDAVERLLRSPTHHEDDFLPSWNYDGSFDFAETVTFNGIPVEPWIRVRSHPLTNELIVEPRPDFLLYHALERRTPAVDTVEYVHLLDGAAVVRVRTEQYRFFNPVPHVAVHRDYLRDYLAARKAVLIIDVVADRMANAVTIEDLQLDVVEQERIGDAAWVTTSVHPADATGHGHARGRASLYWKVAVFPYDRPRIRRSPWPTFGLEPRATSDEESPPTFIATSEGDRCLAGAPKSPLYLYFRPEVLEKYLSAAGYGVFFHMRTWGTACGPQGACVSVGMNSRGLVTALARDLGKLRASEQLYWCHYSTLPDGDICREQWDTEMQQRPPHSPNTIEVIKGARSQLASAFQARFSNALFDGREPPEREQQRMSVGPLRDDMQEVAELAKSLYSWVVERMAVDFLRAALKLARVPYGPEEKQIALLAKVVGLATETPDEARRLMSPLRGLNDLRVSVAHSLERSPTSALQSIGVDMSTTTARPAWNGVVDSIAEMFLKAAEVLRRA